MNLNQEFLRLDSEIQKHPDDLNLKMDQAYLYTQGFEFERAAEIYKAVLQKEASNLRATSELCVINTQLRLTDEALLYCKKAVELDSKNYLAYDNLGLSFFKLGLAEQSLKPFLEAIALQPAATEVRYHLAQSYMALGEYSVALDALNHLIAQPTLNESEKALVFHGLYLVNLRLKNYSESYHDILETYRLSGNGLFMGKVVVAFIKSHQFLVFCGVSVIWLWLSHYFGQRLNRFLKNE